MTGNTPRDGSRDALKGLISHFNGQLSDEEVWPSAQDALKSGDVSLHLAVLTKPFLGPLLNGINTIESKLSWVRGRTYGVLHPGDVVAVKQPGGAVVGASQAGEARSYEMTPGLTGKIRARSGQQIQAHEDRFLDNHADSR
jgi:hypothetical protein